MPALFIREEGSRRYRAASPEEITSAAADFARRAAIGSSPLSSPDAVRAYLTAQPVGLHPEALRVRFQGASKCPDGDQ